MQSLWKMSRFSGSLRSLPCKMIKIVWIPFWHFTIRGPPKTDFEGGIYHGLVSLPYEYPMKPPYIMFFTVSHPRFFEIEN